MFGMVSRAFNSVKRACPMPTFGRRSGRQADVNPRHRVRLITRLTRRDRHREAAPRRRLVEVLVVLAFAIVMILTLLYHTVPV